MTRKGRTALVAIAIFIGVAGTIALSSLSDIVVSQMREDIKEDELAMITTYVTVNAGATLDNSAYMRDLAAIEHLTELTGGIESLAQFKINADDDGFEDGQVLAYGQLNADGVIESRNLDVLSIQPGRLIEGNFPAAGQQEVAIEQRMADKFNLKVGDTFYIRPLTVNESGKIGDVEAWRVSGIVFHAYSQLPNFSIYSNLDDAGYISGGTGLNVFKTRFDTFSNAEAHNDTFTNTITNNSPYRPAFSQIEDPEKNSLITGAQTLAGTMQFLAVMALIVSGFLVINVITSIVVEQKRQIGVMKSMGATRFDNFFMYSGIALAYGVIGVIPGVLVGIPIGNYAAHALAPNLNTVIDGFRISVPSIILGVVLGLLVPAGASLLPVFMGTRVRILEAMTDLGIDAKYGSGPIAKFISWLPLPILVRQGLSNVSIKKGRLVFTVITLALAVGVFMGIFAVFNSLTSGIDLFLDSFNVQMAIAPNEGRDPDEIMGLLRENFQSDENNVLKQIEPGFQLQVEFEGYSPALSTGGPPGIFAYGYDINSSDPSFKFTIDEGETLTDENSANSIIFSSLLASNMDVELGDEVTIKVPGNTAKLKIVGISDYPIDQVWLDWRTLATISLYTSGAPTPNQYLSEVKVAGFEGDTVAIGGFDLQVAPFLTLTEGRFVEEDENAVVISQALAEAGDYAVGDSLDLSATTSTGTSGTFPIVGIIEIPETLAETVPTHVIGMYWKNLASLEGLSLTGEPVPQAYFLISSISDPTIDQVDDLLDDINTVMLDHGIASQSLNFVELVEQISSIFLTFQVILQAVAFLIAMVGALGLLTTLSMSVFERQKEIGVMRSIGASSRIVAGQFLTEGIVVGVIAWIVGLPIGYLIQLLLLSITGFDETFPASFPLMGAILGLVGMLVITIVASLWPSLSAARRTVSDILRYQ